jgi:CubicO group peptidase (beta-lactamase class C family)
MDAAIDNALTEQRIVGTVVVVLLNGKFAYQRAAGLADREADKPMRVNEIFRLASLSKPIVTVAALRFVKEGRLYLDDSDGHSWKVAWAPVLELRKGILVLPD